MSTAPNMATITAALERSLQKCSLSHIHHQAVTSSDSHGHGGVLANSSSSSNGHQNQNHHLLQPHSTLDLNSHSSLPYHWEQCLDLQTGEIYYINWRNGMKAKEDPRRSTTEDHHQYTTEDHYYCYYSDDDDDDSSSYDSEESSAESSNINNNNQEGQEKEEETVEEKEDGVFLVVAGCKSCLMYFMVPKHLEDCPKCTTGQLLHFDRSENDIP